MYLLLLIVASAFLGFVLLMLDPLFGGVIAFGIVTGCLFRVMFLLQDIHKQVVPVKEKVKVQQAYNSFLEERGKNRASREE